MGAAMRLFGWVLLTVAVAVTGLAGAVAAPVRASSGPRVLLVGSYHGVRGQFSSIRAALAAARPGDWILVGPGDYKAASYGGGAAGSGGVPAPAGAFITTPGIHLRGMNRNAVIIDGTRPGSPPCSPRRADQVLTKTGRNGIEVYRASRTWVENLTVCNYLTNNAGANGNEIWWNGGQGTGRSGMSSYWGDYLTATSTYSDGTSAPYADYGIYADNATGPGSITHTYASNQGDSAYYIGACPDCRAVLSDAHAERSALGFSGTNSGGHLIIENSVFDHNKSGLTANSQNNDDAPSPQSGACPAGRAGPLRNGSCEIWRNNKIVDNNNPNVPGNSTNGLAGASPIGSGIVLAGTRQITLWHNQIVGNGSWGVLVADLPDQESPPTASNGENCQGGTYLVPPPPPATGQAPLCYFQALGNQVLANHFARNGRFANPTNGDVALYTTPSADLAPPHHVYNADCFARNTDPAGLTSDPRAVQSDPLYACGRPTPGNPDPALVVQAECAAQLFAPCPAVPGLNYPRPKPSFPLPMPGAQPTMPDPCAGVPSNPWCPAARPAAPAASWATPVYRAGDYGGGLVRSILPAGENGLVNAAGLATFEATGARPAGSQDQLAKYANLLYAGPGLTNARLPRFYDDESFGVRRTDITATVRPNPKIPVVIYYDTHHVPHIYGATDKALAYGAGWAAAHDRLFLMDVLRHYGSGTLSQFLGPSCADEQMDHDQLLVADYTTAQANAQIAALPKEYGAQGARLVTMGKAYVAGINGYVSATRTDPSLLPADYAAVGAPPQPWSPADVISVASLVGGIFGKGGGGEIANAALLQYLDRQLGSTSAGRAAFAAFKEQNDPAAPTTVAAKFPYEVPGKVNPATTAVPDNAAAPLTSGPTDTTTGCNATPPNPAAMAIIASLLRLPRSMAMSNALLVGATHSATGHPVAVFGPQVGYFAPQILMEEDLHAPDIAAEGAAFPGTSFVVELGRGPDFAWSATSAESDVVDQRLELICDPGGGPPASHGTHYMFDGKCLPMTHHTFTEDCVPKPGGTGLPVVIHHQLYNTRHGIVQGWTTAGGKPVAVVNQRSTFGHEVDSGVGFLRWNTPSLTTGPRSWMAGAEQVQYTFNWFYVDDKHIAYYQSGLDPVRPSDVDPNLPTWGTGNAEWRGFLPAAAHPHAIDPRQGFLTSWNNKPAPGFSAADDNYTYGPVQRVQSLNQEIERQFAIHHGKLTEADVVTAMETAASADLTGRQVVPVLLAETAGRAEPAGVRAMLNQLRTWVAAGAPRRKASPSDAQYAHAAAIAIMDELWPRLIQAVSDPLFAAGGVQVAGGTATGYRAFPMSFEDTPNGGGAHHGSAYQSGWDGYLVKILDQMLRRPVAQPFPAVVTSRVCGGGLGTCPAAIDTALARTYDALVTANGGSNHVAAWTQDTATKAAGQTMPAYDGIQFASVGIVGQPAIDWQNRPTFQQVAQFPAHR